jgi:hypothetical protein
MPCSGETLVGNAYLCGRPHNAIGAPHRRRRINSIPRRSPDVKLTRRSLSLCLSEAALGTGRRSGTALINWTELVSRANAS